jgi:hypothetical protein
VGRYRRRSGFAAGAFCAVRQTIVFAVCLRPVWPTQAGGLRYVRGGISVMQVPARRTMAPIRCRAFPAS